MSARLSFGLLHRLAVLAIVLSAEAIVASVFLDGDQLARKQGALIHAIRFGGPWVVRFAIALAGIFTTFALLKYSEPLAAISDRIRLLPLRPAYVVGHLVALIGFSALSAAMYGGRELPVAPEVLAMFWIVCAFLTAAFAALSLAPVPLWIGIYNATGPLAIYSILGALAACFAGVGLRSLWEPTTRLTFELVRLILTPLVPGIRIQTEISRLSTESFGVRISQECSGLEGIALLLAFGVLWLLLFRKDLRFPHSFLLLAGGVVVLYFCNVLRIAGLFLIGNAGAPKIAAGGFHSQAGWIVFSGVAFGLTMIANRLPWFSNQPEAPQARSVKNESPAAPWLMPFLVILAAGMVARAISADFEWFYALRFFAALTVLWRYRLRYADVDWRCSWVAPVAGLLVFVLWVLPDFWLGGQTSVGSGLPAPLAEASVATRMVWTVLRILSAIITVPLAEELAFRGFLFRRLISSDFENVPFRAWTLFSVAGSSLAFGFLHGGRWIEGALAGCAYAYVMVRHGKLGDAIVAHSVTNCLLAIYVLTFDRWALW